MKNVNAIVMNYNEFEDVIGLVLTIEDHSQMLPFIRGLQVGVGERNIGDDALGILHVVLDTVAATQHMGKAHF